MVIFVLGDKDTGISEKEEVAKKLFSIPRPEKIDPGKPIFPLVIFGDDGAPPRLSSFVTERSWLLFDLLGLDGVQEWLQTPPTMWEMFAEYRKLKDYVVNVCVVNDLAERGMHLITKFAGKCKNTEERQALLQVVEQHKNQFKDFNKTTLAKL